MKLDENNDDEDVKTVQRNQVTSLSSASAQIEQLNQLAVEMQENLDVVDELIDNGTVVVGDQVINQVREARDGWYYARAVGLAILVVICFAVAIALAVVFGKK